MRLFTFMMSLYLACIAQGTGGYVEAEAESFQSEAKTEIRRWHVVRDDIHARTASGGAYLQVLPDTRRTRDDKLVRGENFTDDPGTMAVLEYKVKFDKPGRYFVWVRSLSTGTEDNSIHVGLNGQWPESGKRMQWCEGKNAWRWESKQRTGANHCGEAGMIFLDVEGAGEHVVMFAMREDGFRFDKWFMTTDPAFPRPE